MQIFVIVIVALSILSLSSGKVRDILNIPKSNLVYAKVVEKEYIGVEGIGTRYNHTGYKLTHYKITFEIGNSSETLVVSRKVYESVSEGSAGVLAYSGSRFRGFYEGKEISDIAAPKKKGK